MNATITLGDLLHVERTLASRTLLARFDDWTSRFSDFDEDIEGARARLELRLDSDHWTPGDAPAARHKHRPRIPTTGPATIEHDLSEWFLLHSLALTYPAHQFSVTPKGRVFAGYRHGNHREHHRLYVTGLSEILDEAAILMHAATQGRGGRIYIASDQIQIAKTLQVLANLRLIQG